MGCLSSSWSSPLDTLMAASPSGPERWWSGAPTGTRRSPPLWCRRRRETGARLPSLTLFSLPPEQVPEALVSLSKPENGTLHTEMLAAFRPEYLVFFPEHLELNFPRGTLPSQEYDYIAALDYTPQLTALLQSWAIPLDN